MAKGDRHFDLTLPWEDGEIQVTGYVSKYHPAVFYLRNGDPGYPAEGGEIEDFKAILPDGTELEDPDGKILEALSDDIYQAVDESRDDGPDPDDKYDSDRNGD